MMITRNCFIRLFLLLLLVCRRSSSFVLHTSNRRSFTHDRSVQLNGAAAASAVETFFITKPYVAAFLTCSVKASAADWIAQTKASTTTVDLQRNLAFLLYGGLYQGMAQQFMYSTVFPNMFGHELDMMGLASQVSFDMICVGPCLCLPICYAVKSLVSTADTRALQQGMEKYVHDVTTQGLLLKYWGLWTPVNFLTFGVVPMHFRVAFVASISFFWIFILSTTAASESKDD